MLIRLYFSRSHRHHATSSCSQSSSSLSFWTHSTGHTQICDAVHSPPCLPTRLCPFVKLNVDPIPTEDTHGTSSTCFQRPCPPGKTPGLRSHALWVDFLRVLHFLDLVLGFQVPFPSKCSGSRTLGSFRCHGQQVGFHKCFGAFETGRDQFLRLESMTLV